ncbi:MAG: aldehyde dehydrogenase family protein [Microbacteriaceae bacterium]|nr:aldehyde dehydrogenase family protein [Microbacteriaceae bacterium]
MTITDALPLISPTLASWLNDVSRGKFSTPDIATSGEIAYPVLDPGTGRTLANVPISNSDHVARAVRKARAAMDDGRWSEQDPDYREAALLRLAALVERDFDTLVTLEAVDTGKPRAEAALDIHEVTLVLRYYAGWCTKVTGSTIAAPRQFAAQTIREAVGVCVAITPWNYPLPILMYKLAPALAFGNSIVAKPSELAPLSSIYFLELCSEAGIPDGVVSLVLGPGEVGADLVSQPGIDKISFTGSTTTGKAIMRAAAEHPTKVTLELGGKSPHIVFASADLDAAVAGVAAGIWTNAGQVCVAGSRLLVEESVKEIFIQKLVAFTDEYHVGHALDDRSMMGPMISARQLEKAQATITEAQKSGARITTAGTVHSEVGTFLAPTIIDGLDGSHAAHQEEIFGPVLTVDSFGSEDEAATRANSTPFGLAAGVWTDAAGQSTRMARKLNAGTVWVNTYGVFHPTLPFGGTKASGFGRELGESAVEAYTQTKTIVEDIAGRGGE